MAILRAFVLIPCIIESTVIMKAVHHTTGVSHTATTPLLSLSLHHAPKILKKINISVKIIVSLGTDPTTDEAAWFLCWEAEGSGRWRRGSEGEVCLVEATNNNRQHVGRMAIIHFLQSVALIKLMMVCAMVGLDE